MSNDNGSSLASALLSLPGGRWKQIFTYNNFAMLIAEPDLDGDYKTDCVLGISIEPPHACFVELGRNTKETLKNRLIANSNAVLVDVLCQNVNPSDGLVYIPTKTVAAALLDALVVEDGDLKFKDGEVIWTSKQA
jgi:hypothetical protein